jgi:hypothetical protein
VPLNGSTVLGFTINNPNASALTGVGFTDTLPAGVVVLSLPPNQVPSLVSCGGGTITAIAGSDTVSVAGATVAAGAPCFASLFVTFTTVGIKNNTTSPVTSVEGGTGGVASATVAVVAIAPPRIAKRFVNTLAGKLFPFLLNGSVPLEIFINNPNPSTTLTGVGFTDTLPAGLVVSTPNNLTGSCGGGTITAIAGSGAVSLTGAALAASASCSFSVRVTGTTLGIKNNTTSPVTSVEGGTGGTASAGIAVTELLPPTILKSFGAASIPLDGSTSLSFTISNPNCCIFPFFSGTGFTDTLPAGLVVSTPNRLTGGCGGGTITAIAGSGAVSLTGALLEAFSSCTFSLNVTGTTPGIKTNTTGAVTSTQATGSTASASVSVAAVGATTNIPTLEPWALGLLGLLLIVTASVVLRGHKIG